MIVKVSTGNGLAPSPLKFNDEHVAWGYICDIYHSICKSENPDVMPIRIEIGKEETEDDII